MWDESAASRSRAAALLSFGVEYLPLEVALAHRIRIGQSDASHAGSRQVEGCGRAEPADADDQHRSL